MSQYNIYQSNSLAGLIEQYPGRLVPSGLFDDSFCLIVQNRNMGEWLKLELARLRGISADFRYVMPEKGLREFCGGYSSARVLSGEGESAKPVLFLDNLKLILYKTLESLLSSRGADPVYEDLFRYVRSGDPSDEKHIQQVRTSRLYELADSIAGLFYHYGMNCRDLIAPWERGESFPGMPGPLKTHEKWQKELWNILFHPEQPYVHLSQLLSGVMEHNDSYDGPMKRVALFGSSFLGDTGLKFFFHLSKDIQVDHFILSPSKVYSNWNGEVQNALLGSWSTLIGGFATLAGSFALSPRHNEYQSASGDTLLSSLKNDMLEDRTTEEPTPVRPEDSSLRIHTFTSPWREIEVLKDLILNELDRDETLKLTDICILAPDINEYAPFLEALFPSFDENGAKRDHLPYNVIDLAGASESPYIQGFLQLFSLPGERFSRKDLFLLFDNPCFCETFRINRVERDFWLELCEELNIKWGIDQTHKKEFYPEATDFNSWEEGFRRLRDGFFLEEDDDEANLPFGLSDETGNQSAGKLMGIVENLFNDLYELNRIELPLEQWILLAEALMESYLAAREDHPQDQMDRRRLKGTFRDLLALSEESVLPDKGDRALDFVVFRILLTEFIRKSSGERGRYLTQGITCSSLKPLRAIPFRRIYILGLDENAFPGEDLQLSFDLREVVQQTIDLSRRGSDKYAFLETLLSAGDGLTLFYHDRDPIRGEALQPSMLISELLEYLDQSYSFPGGAKADEWLVRRESIHDYDARYFSGEAGFRSFNAAALKSASIALHPSEEGHGGTDLGQPASDLGGLITIRELEQFLQNPASYYFKKSLGIYLEEEENREEDSEENWESGFIERYRYLSRSLDAPDALDDPDAIKRFLEDQQKRGKLPDSQLIFLEEDFYTNRLSEIRKQLEEKGLRDGLPDVRDYLIDPENARGSRFRDEEIRPPRVVPQLLFPGEKEGPVRVAGLLEELSPLPEEAGVWGTMEYCEAGTPGVRHFLKSYLKALLLHALDTRSSIETIRMLRLYQIGKRSYPLVHFHLEPLPGEVASGMVPLTDPEGRVQRLIRFCREQQKTPVMLYPELGERLGQDLAAKPDLTDRELEALWASGWNRLAEADSFRGYSPFALCPYRKQFLTKPPETDPKRLREFLETVYLPFCLKEFGNES